MPTSLRVPAVTGPTGTRSGATAATTRFTGVTAGTIITGGEGADYLDGGGAFDQAIYKDSPVGVMVFLSPGLGFGGTAEGDVLVSIENVSGSEYADVLSGDGGRNELYGRNGNDTLKGGGGYDRLAGDAGNDILMGGADGDYLHGGSGYDTASYEGSSTGVVVSLITDSAAYGDAQGDELDSIENLTGSRHADNLIGDNGANVLNGLGGNDTLKGYGGSDSLVGGDGNDFLDGMTGIDTMNGGNGADTFIVDSAFDTVIDSSAGTYDTVRASTSYTLSATADIEMLKTTNDAGFGSIDLTGNDSSQEIRGNAGNNNLTGGGGTDILTGFAGEDAFIFNSALGASNIDAITDYNVAQDQIRLDNAIFTNLSVGEGNWLSAGEFHIGAAAADANDRIIYNSATGALFYDADGSGAGAAVQFATLSTGLALTSNEFYIV